MVTVSEVTEADAGTLAAVARLVPQLSASAPAPGPGELAEIVASPATRLLVATDPTSAEVLGMLTLVLFRAPTGVRAWIEDVVVDGRARGRGVATALTRHALDLASQAGARTVDLTSRPSRDEANRLYRGIGFEARETNVYRYDLAGG